MRPANRFVASFVGANNFLDMSRDGAALRLRSGGADLAARVTAAGALACAIRPEHLDISPGHSRAGTGRVAIPARLREVSFIGREMEVFGVTAEGEELKAVARPDPLIVALPIDSPITFDARLDNLMFFESGELGARVA
jgi:iron(III) transport system ATP-binding protein